MGMYTQLHVGVELKDDTPQEVIDTLSYMVGNREEEPKFFDHPLFNTPRWAYMFTCTSFYFDTLTLRSLEKDDITSSYYLTVICDFKHYNNEIELFFDWINPYIETTGMLGFFRYEERELPTIIFRNYKSKTIRYIEMGDVYAREA